jgi:hypothetical protein
LNLEVVHFFCDFDFVVNVQRSKQHVSEMFAALGLQFSEYAIGALPELASLPFYSVDVMHVGPIPRDATMNPLSQAYLQKVRRIQDNVRMPKSV